MMLTTWDQGSRKQGLLGVAELGGDEHQLLVAGLHWPPLVAANPLKSCGEFLQSLPAVEAEILGADLGLHEKLESRARASISFPSLDVRVTKLDALSDRRCPPETFPNPAGRPDHRAPGFSGFGPFGGWTSTAQPCWSSAPVSTSLMRILRMGSRMAWAFLQPALQRASRPCRSW